MYPSSTLCRAQEEFHRSRAAGATLENVRAISAGAAAAWGLEAVAAEKREARGAKTRAIADLMAARSVSTREAERQFRENRQQGFEMHGGA